jgi:hypothetical protein
VKHRSRVARDPTQPNLRQVHPIHEELHDELRAAGFRVAPGVRQRARIATGTVLHYVAKAATLPSPMIGGGASGTALPPRTVRVVR